MGQSRGFTLTEILIALAIVAVFITLPMLAYGNYMKKSRDLKRKNDISALQQSIEQYKANNGVYPDDTDWMDTLVSGGYIPDGLEDPKDGDSIPGETGLTYGYSYNVNASGTDYTLTARLEGSGSDVGGGAGSGAAYYVSTPSGPEVVHVTPGTGLPPTNTPPASTPTSALNKLAPSSTPRPSSAPITGPTSTPTRTPSPTRSPTPSFTPTNTPTHTPTPSFTTSPTPTNIMSTNCDTYTPSWNVTSITPEATGGGYYRIYVNGYFPASYHCSRQSLGGGGMSAVYVFKGSYGVEEKSYYKYVPAQVESMSDTQIVLGPTSTYTSGYHTMWVIYCSGSATAGACSGGSGSRITGFNIP